MGQTKWVRPEESGRVSPFGLVLFDLLRRRLRLFLDFGNRERVLVVEHLRVEGRIVREHSGDLLVFEDGFPGEVTRGDDYQKGSCTNGQPEHGVS